MYWQEEWASKIKEVFKDSVWKMWRDVYEKYVRNGRRRKWRVWKEVEKDKERQRKEIQRFREQEEHQRQAESEKALKAAAKLQKVAEAAAK